MLKKYMKKLGLGLLILSLGVTGCGTKQPKQQEEGVTKVGFIYSSPLADGGWVQSHDEGRKYLEEQLGVETMYQESVPETQEVERVTRDMIDQGASIIFAVSFGYMNYIEQLAHEFPEVTFFHCSGFKTAENMSNYFGRVEDARYLSGLVAGLKTETNKIGYVAAMPIPEVIRGINAFTQGVRAVNKEATVHVSWTNTWYDPAKEKEAGSALIDNGCDVLAQHQNAAGAQQAAEEKGKWAIGYHADMKGVAPKANLTSVLWNWGPYYVEAVKSVQEGTYVSGAYWEGIDKGIVGIAPLTDNAPKEAKDIVELKKQQMIEKAFNVFQGPIKDQKGQIRVEEGTILSDQDQLSMNWFVEGVVGEIQ